MNTREVQLGYMLPQYPEIWRVHDRVVQAQVPIDRRKWLHSEVHGLNGGVFSIVKQQVKDDRSLQMWIVGLINWLRWILYVFRHLIVIHEVNSFQFLLSLLIPNQGNRLIDQKLFSHARCPVRNLLGKVVISWVLWQQILSPQLPMQIKRLIFVQNIFDELIRKINRVIVRKIITFCVLVCVCDVSDGPYRLSLSHFAYFLFSLSSISVPIILHGQEEFLRIICTDPQIALDLLPTTNYVDNTGRLQYPTIIFVVPRSWDLRYCWISGGNWCLVGHYVGENILCEHALHHEHE